jgi:guanylate kinase
MAELSTETLPKGGKALIFSAPSGSGKTTITTFSKRITI